MKKVSVDVYGHVQMPVYGSVVIAVGEGVTDDDLYEQASKIVQFCPNLENADGGEEDPGNIFDPELEGDLNEVDDEPADCIAVRDEAGRIVIKKVEE